MQFKAVGLTKDFGRLRAVDALSFSLGDGEIWGFIGPNGAGKTTTLRMLATIEDPTAGDAWVDGHSITQDADLVRPRIGFMPDYFGSYPDMTVAEYLDFFARAYDLRGARRRQRIAAIVEFVEMAPLLTKKVTELSKGMRQRISLGRSLLHDPDILLLDEPAAGLDPRARADLRELLKLLASEKKTILISSHILAELEDLVDKVLIIHEGKLVYAGDPKAHDAARPGSVALSIRIVGNLAAANRILLETPGVSDVQVLEPDELRLRVAGAKAEIAAVVANLVACDVLPYRVVTEEVSLEKVFLDATGKKPNPPANR